MNKYVYMALLTVGLSIPAFSATSVPIPTTDKQIVDSKFAGVSTCVIDQSTAAAAVLCTTGSGIILDIVASSVATTDTLFIRDTATANTSVTSTSGLIYAIDKNSLDKANRVFPRFKNGLSANAGTSPSIHAGNAFFPSWIIVYTKDLY